MAAATPYCTPACLLKGIYITSVFLLWRVYTRGFHSCGESPWSGRAGSRGVGSSSPQRYNICGHPFPRMSPRLLGVQYLVILTLHFPGCSELEHLCMHLFQKTASLLLGPFFQCLFVALSNMKACWASQTSLRSSVLHMASVPFLNPLLGASIDSYATGGLGTAAYSSRTVVPGKMTSQEGDSLLPCKVGNPPAYVPNS